MVLTINPSKFADFILDNQGELHVPRYFEEYKLMDLSKEIIKMIAKCYLATGETVIKGATFHNMLDNNKIEFDRYVVKSILELQGQEYFEMNI